MPVDRFFHPRAGHSTKVTSLTDLEFRVWWTYVMAADDYGVMRCSAVTIQAVNDALAQQSRHRVDGALKRLVSVGLLTAFEHQDRLYVCQLTWQDFQKVKYPRESMEPLPTPEVLEKCSKRTRALFAQHSGNFPEMIPKDLPRAGAREEANANGLRQEADGERRTAADESAEADPAARVLTAFRGYWKRTYGHECSLITKPIEDMQLAQQIAAHSEVNLLQALAAFFATEDKFVKNAKHPLPMFLRDPLKYLARPAAGAVRDPVAETQAEAEEVREILRQQERVYGTGKR